MTARSVSDDDRKTAVLKQTKAEWLAQIRPRQMAYHDFQELSATVTLDNDKNTAVVVTKSLITATIHGAHGTWPLESTTTYIHDGGAWKASHSTATTFQPPHQPGHPSLRHPLRKPSRHTPDEPKRK
jgi:hypothetical protein